MDSAEKPGISWYTDVDTLDIATDAGRSVNEFMLEGVNTPGIYLHAYIGYMEVVVNVGGKD